MSSRDIAIVGELFSLLSVSREAPTSAIGCDHLIQYLVEVQPRFERRAAQATWFLIVDAVSSPDRSGATTRPLLAAKHLLALGDYPADLGPDADTTEEEICRTKPVSDSFSPSKHVTVRRKIASRAGGFGVDPSNLNPSHKSKKLRRIAEAVWAEIQDLLQNQDRIERLASQVEAAEPLTGARDESKGSRAREIAIRRLQRIRRRKLSSRLRRVSPVLGWLFLAAILVYWSSNIGVDIFRTFAGVEIESDVDPMVALESGSGWIVGVGPDQEVRDQLGRGDLAFNVLNEGWILGPATIRSSFVSLTGDLTKDAGITYVKEGTYPVEIRVRLEHEGYWGNDLGRTRGASVLLGTIPVQDGAYTYAVFARIEAEGVSPVWDGEGFNLHPDCDCTFTIDPDSVRLFSKSMPNGLPIGTDQTPVASLIGFDGADGVLWSGAQNDVRIYADLVVSERRWQD